MSNWQATIPNNGAAVTPADTGTLEQPSTIYIGVGGNIKVLTTREATLTFIGVIAGTVLPVQVKRVFSTDTTATNLVALW